MNNERVSSSAPKRLVSSPAPKRLVDITNSGLTGPPSIRKRTSAAATRAAEPGPPHRVDAEAIKELPKTAAQAAAPAEPPARTEAAAPTCWPRPVGAAVAWCRDAIVRSSELPPEPLADSLALGLVGGLWPIPGTVEITSLAAAHAIHADMLVVTLATTIMYPLHFLLITRFASLGQWLFGDGDGPTLDVHALHSQGLSRDALRGAARGLSFAVLGWACVCVPAGFVLSALLRATLRTRAKRAKH